MPQINFEEVFNTLKQGVTTLAQTTMTNYVDQAKADGQSLLKQMKTELHTWTLQFLNGEITGAELRDLIEGQKELWELNALTQAGIADLALNNFKNSVLNLITNTILGLTPDHLGGGGWGDEGSGDNEEEESGGGGWG